MSKYLPVLTPLKWINNDKGDVLHAMRSFDTEFFGFGEAYFSFVNYGDTKGWKQHLEMTLNLVVPVGEVRFTVYDPSKQIRSTYVLGKSNYQRLTLPPRYWLAFSGVGQELNLVMNIADLPHDPSEVLTLPLEDMIL